MLGMPTEKGMSVLDTDASVVEQRFPSDEGNRATVEARDRQTEIE